MTLNLTLLPLSSDYWNNTQLFLEAFLYVKPFYLRNKDNWILHPHSQGSLQFWWNLRWTAPLGTPTCPDPALGDTHVPWPRSRRHPRVLTLLSGTSKCPDPALRDTHVPWPHSRRHPSALTLLSGTPKCPDSALRNTHVPWHCSRGHPYVLKLKMELSLLSCGQERETPPQLWGQTQQGQSNRQAPGMVRLRNKSRTESKDDS